MTTDVAAKEYYVSEDMTLRYTVRNKATGLAIDVTGWSFDWRLLKGQQELFKVAPSINDPINGIVDVAIASTDTDGLARRPYRYELWRINDGARRLLAFGQFVIS